MNLHYLIKGMFIGLSIAAPVGAIGILCIRRTLDGGMMAGFSSGLGAATADAAYGCVAGFGLTSVSGFLSAHRQAIGFIGGAFLCYLGIRTILTRPAALSGKERARQLLSAYASTLLLTIANPSTVLSFMVVFAALGLGVSTGYLSAAYFVLGVFLGSTLWWLVLSGGVSLARSRLRTGWVLAVNRVSGLALFALGIVVLCRL